MMNVMKLIKVFSFRNDIIIDENPTILVTDAGAWDIVTGELGNTGPSDYVTDSQMIGVSYEPPDEDKILFLQNEFAAKLFPDASLRRIFLEQRSTALYGGSSQKWIEADIGLRMSFEKSNFGTCL